MKNKKTLGLIITLILIFISCEQLPDPAGERGVAVVPGISGLNPGVFDINDLENAFIQFTVSLPTGATVSGITLIGSYNNNHADVEITELTTFPAVVTIASADVADKMGIALADIARGDVFDFELLITANGRTTRSTPLVVPAACVYNEAMATGSYNVVVADWPADYDVTITTDPADEYTIYVAGLSVLDGCVEDHGPFVMHINPITYAITAESKLLASDYFGYGSITLGGTGVFSTCDGAYTLALDISVGDYGSQGIFQFDLTRNP
jgi:hypothetical protein